MAKCNLGKVNLEAMLVSCFPSYIRGGPMSLAGAPRDLYTQLLACSSSQSVVAIACCLRDSLCFGFSHPSLPLGGGLRKSWVGKYSTELFSVTVPGGGRSQGCHGYLLLMLEHCPAPANFEGTNAQAHLLVMSLTTKLKPCKTSETFGRSIWAAILISETSSVVSGVTAS